MRKGPYPEGRLAGAEPNYRRPGVRRLDETANPLPEVFGAVSVCRKRSAEGAVGYAEALDTNYSEDELSPDILCPSTRISFAI